jgi:hypothetical protein
MVHVTERAKEALFCKKLSANLDRPDIGLRLAAGPGGRLGLVADRVKAGDQVVTHKDSMVLLVDPLMSALVVAGRFVDCRRTDDGTLELVLRRTTIDGGTAADAGR